MNALTKALFVFFIVLSAVAYASWSPAKSEDVSGAIGVASSGVAIATSADGKTIYYAHSRNLYKSTDSGETWVLLK